MDSVGGSPDQYDLVVRRRGDDFVALVPSLAICEKGGDLDELEARVRGVIAERLDRYADAGVLPPSQEVNRGADAQPAGANREISRFAIKTAIGWSAVLLVAVIAVYPLTAALRALEHAAYQRLDAINARVDSALQPHSLALALARTVETFDSITDERREEIVSNLNRLSQQLEPYAAPLRPLISGPAGIDQPDPTPASRRTSPGETVDQDPQ